MELLIAAVVASGFVSLTIHLVRRSRKAATSTSRTPKLLQTPEVERGFQQLQTGDVLVFGRRDLMIKTVHKLQEGAEDWLEAIAEEEGEERWLRVDDRDPDAVVIGHRITLAGQGEQPSEALDFENEIYRLRRTGVATRTEDRVSIRYWDYEKPGTPRVWIRQIGEQRFAFFGERARRHLIDMLPGEQIEAED
jgi:hypothetical protein